MSSIKIHMIIAKRVQKRLGLGADFMLGSILPDLYKQIYDRENTHFEIRENNELKLDIESFGSKYLNKKDGLIFGYLAHLIEDQIWYENYECKYRSQRFINEEDFLNTMYRDYDVMDEHLVKSEIDILKVKDEIKNVLKKSNLPECEKISLLIDEKIKVRNMSSEKKTTYLTVKACKEYIKKSTEEVIKIIKELM